MKFNGTIFSKPQQDQLKEVIGKDLEAVVKKVNDVDARMLNYTGDWMTGNEYHEHDVVTWSNGNLYEVIKAHTSSSTIDPSNTEYYKAMTASAAENKYYSKTYSLTSNGVQETAIEDVKNALTENRRAFFYRTDGDYTFRVEFNEYKNNAIIAHGFYLDAPTAFPYVFTCFLGKFTATMSKIVFETSSKETIIVPSQITIYYES